GRVDDGARPRKGPAKEACTRSTQQDGESPEGGHLVDQGSARRAVDPRIRSLGRAKLNPGAALQPGQTSPDFAPLPPTRSALPPRFPLRPPRSRGLKPRHSSQSERRRAIRATCFSV